MRSANSALLEITLLCLLFFKVHKAQFPRPCTTKEALKSKSCCPIFGDSICGVNSGRGVCTSYKMDLMRDIIDYRVNWPGVFYDSVCRCNGNFDGFNCGQCKPGWQGPLCSDRHHLERKEITSLTKQERDTFISNLNSAKFCNSDNYMILISNDTTLEDNFEFQNTSVYNLYAWMHNYAAKSYDKTKINAAHRGPAFAFWHRIFLLFIEREIRELTGNQDFFIPYWDWTRTDHCNICTNKYLGGVGPDGRIDSASPFSKWEPICTLPQSLRTICVKSDNSILEYLTRNPGKDPMFQTLPTVDDVTHTMSAKNYDTSPYDHTAIGSFRNRLEGFEIPQDHRNLNSSMHNLVHDYLSGTMSDVSTAANDPIFMLHHSFIDKILEDWLLTNTEASYPTSEQIHPSQNALAYMVPFFPLRHNSYFWGLSIRELGYSYKEHEAPVDEGYLHMKSWVAAVVTVAAAAAARLWAVFF